jgi:guanylate kinase
LRPIIEATTGRLEHPEGVFVVSGPSGVGKNTLVQAVCAAGRATRAVTATTRTARLGEVDGRDYYFVSEKEFEGWLREGRLLEHTRYCGHYYGTPAFSVNRAARSGRPVLLVIDVDGALQLRSRWPGVRMIFVAPPSLEALGDRLAGRGDTGEQNIRRRLDRAREEMAMAPRYDWTVVNDCVERAADEIGRILEQAAMPGRQDRDRK